MAINFLGIPRTNFGFGFLFVWSFSSLYFSFIWRRHHYRWRAANSYLCSALTVIKLWGFFTVPHLLWHRASVTMVTGPVTLTPIAERFGSGAVTTCVHDLGLPRLGFEHPTFRLRGERFNSPSYQFWKVNRSKDPKGW